MQSFQPSFDTTTECSRRDYRRRTVNKTSASAQLLSANMPTHIRLYLRRTQATRMGSRFTQDNSSAIPLCEVPACSKHNPASLSLLPMAQGRIWLRANTRQCRSKQNQPKCSYLTSLSCRRLPTQTWHTTSTPVHRHQCSLLPAHQRPHRLQMQRNHHIPTSSRCNIIRDQYHPRRRVLLCQRRRSCPSFLRRHSKLLRKPCPEPINSRIGNRPRRQRRRNRPLRIGDTLDSFHLSHSMSL